MKELPQSGVVAAVSMAALLSLCGCTAATQDPAQANFFSGAANLANGTYDQRLALRQQQLNNLEQLDHELKARADAALSAQQKSEAELSDWQRRVARMNEEAAQLERNLAAATSQLGRSNPRIVEGARRLREYHTAQEQIEADPAPSRAAQELLERNLQSARDAIAAISRAE